MRLEAKIRYYEDNGWDIGCEWWQKGNDMDIKIYREGDKPETSEFLFVKYLAVGGTITVSSDDFVA